jgi:hypothetical protein
MPNKLQSGFKHADPVPQVPYYRIDSAAFQKIIYWMMKHKTKGQFIVELFGNEDVIALTYVASTPQYIPITSVDDIENIINPDTEGDEE